MHLLPVRVWYEDTDLGGVVYHANHLKFCERGRSDALRLAGVDQNAMKAEGLVFVVRAMECDWLAPARLDDALTVTTQTLEIRRASVLLLQTIRKGEAEIFRARVRIACMSLSGAPRRIPEAAAAALESLIPA